MKIKDNIFTTGEVFIWLTGLGLGLVLMMIAGLLVLVFMKGSEYYWPGKLANITTKSNEKYLGEIALEEKVPVEDLPDSLKNKGLVRYKFKIGNREIYGLDFKWFDESEIVKLDYPSNAIAIERIEFGNFYGYLKQI
ncbi:MAG: phosphate ABC transporter, permease protein PstA, partial [Ignavibacteriaceae bacterium]